MNKNLYFKICSFSIGIFLIFWCVCFTLFIAKDNLSNKAEIKSDQVTESAVKSATVSHYIAKRENGNAVIYEVYTNGFEKIYSMPQIDFSQLTKEDLESFEQGIILKTKIDTANFIEDYTS